MYDLVHVSRDFWGGLYTFVYKNAKYRKVLLGTTPSVQKIMQIVTGYLDETLSFHRNVIAFASQF